MIQAYDHLTKQNSCIISRTLTELIIKRSKIFVFIVFTLFYQCTGHASVKADTMRFLTGACFNSYHKSGAPEADLTEESGDPIHCATAVLGEFESGRKLLQFVAGAGILGFSGAELGPVKGEPILAIPVDTIYPSQDSGGDPNEIREGYAKGEGIQQGAEGYCLISPKNLNSIHKLMCDIKYNTSTKQEIYHIQMSVTKVSKQLILNRR